MDGNGYDLMTLSRKDGFQVFDEKNYMKEDVRVVDGAKEFADLFDNLLADGAARGVIKIDVEGYESAILKQISSVIPEDLSVAIVFENHSRQLLVDDILGMFTSKVALYEIKDQKVRGAKFIRFLKSLIGAKGVISLPLVDSGALAKGNFVLIKES